MARHFVAAAGRSHVRSSTARNSRGPGRVRRWVTPWRKARKNANDKGAGPGSAGRSTCQLLCRWSSATSARTAPAPAPAPAPDRRRVADAEQLLVSGGQVGQQGRTNFQNAGRRPGRRVVARKQHRPVVPPSHANHPGGQRHPVQMQFDPSAPLPADPVGKRRPRRSIDCRREQAGQVPGIERKGQMRRTGAEDDFEATEMDRVGPGAGGERESRDAPGPRRRRALKRFSVARTIRVACADPSRFRPRPRRGGPLVAALPALCPGVSVDRGRQDVA